MEELRAVVGENAPTYLAVGGLLIGAVFGFIVFRTNFCAMGGISDMMSFGDTRRFRSWVLAIATALAGAQILAYFGVVDLELSMYLNPSLNWAGNIIGGVMFGFGMVLAGGCTSRNLVRAGAGDLRSAVVLIVLGLFAYMTIGGIIGPVRVEMQSATAISLEGAGLGTQSTGAMLAKLAGIEAGTGTMIAALVLLGALLGYCFSSPGFRASTHHILTGIGIGLCVVAGWALTGLAYDEFADKPLNPVSLTYVRPTADTLEWLERYTAIPVPSFAVTSVIGCLLGAFVAAIASGRFQLTAFADPRDTLRNLSGAALMGIGGVLALGCTLGQAITGFSTLALGSIITFFAIVGGGIAGIKFMEHLLMADA